MSKSSNLKPFAPGQSGNPGGRPRLPDDVKALARSYTRQAVEVAAAIMLNTEETGTARMSAVNTILDRGWGKAPQARRTGAYVHRAQFATRGDKAVRAQSIRARMSMRGLYVPNGAPWLQDFEAELLRFPAGVHDDQVDALGLIGQLLDRVRPGAAPKAQTKPDAPTGPRYQRASSGSGGSWRV